MPEHDSVDEARQRQRQQAIDALVALRHIFAVVVDTLERDIRTAASLETGLRGGIPVNEMFGEMAMTNSRSDLSAQMVELEAARKAARAALGRTMQFEGVSIGGVARLFGISRQLTSRILRSDETPAASAS